MNDLKIRKMKPAEKKQVKFLMNRSFPLLMRLFYYFTKHIYIAEINDKMDGGIILKIFNLSKSLKAGLVCFVFTDPEKSGLGIGNKLVEKGIKYLKYSKCKELFALVEGDNTGSSKLFESRDFQLLNLWQQLKLFKLSIIPVWFKTYHLFDIGHLMWYKGTRKIKPTRSFAWITTLVLHVLIYLGLLWRAGFKITVQIAHAVAASFIVIFGLRSLSMYVTTKVYKLQTRSMIWESGILLNTLIAFIFGGYLPAPGNIYPKQKEWDYRDYTKILGLAAFVSSLLLTILLFVLYYFISYEIYPAPKAYIEIAYNITLIVTLFDIVLPFFPFSSYNGKRITNFSKTLWILIAIPIYVLFFYNLFK